MKLRYAMRVIVVKNSAVTARQGHGCFANATVIHAAGKVSPLDDSAVTPDPAKKPRSFGALC
ncbi:hypothetical protein [Massilia cavernae]|uniref:hypothetical protein n=1 Tax=Massilia cavernae TaxID=2320864 RepID=UPI0011C39878|nr:hypothetical protein [Massilia cavernae]